MGRTKTILNGFLAFAVAVVFFAAQVHSASCVNPTVAGVAIDSPETYFVAASSVALPPIKVRIVGYQGQYVANTAETVTVTAPSGYVLTGTATLTTANGYVTFTGLALTNPTPATFHLSFTVCGGVGTDRLELTVSAGSADSIGWYRQPEATITSYGYVHVQPQLAYYDSAGEVTNLVHLGQEFTLGTSDSTITIKNNVVTPTGTTGNVVDFPATFYQMTCTPNCAGKTFNLSLTSIGAYTSDTSPVPFPPNLTLTVANCNHDFRITPAQTNITASTFHVMGGSGFVSVPLRGWHFPSDSGTVGSCRYNGQDGYEMTYTDMCTIACSLPGTPNTGYPLSITFNGNTYQDIGTLVMLDAIDKLTPESSAYTLHHEQYAVQRVRFRVLDKLGNFMGANIAPSAMSCATSSLYAAQKRVTTTYHSPKTNRWETPDHSPMLVNGEASVDFVWDNFLEADVHRYCCSVSGVPQGCVNFTVVEDCPTPPVVLYVNNSGCTESGSDFVNCKTGGVTTLTVTGKDFGRQDAKLRIGPWWCESTVHDSAAPSRILYGYGCRGKGTGHRIMVFRPERVYGMYTDGYYSFGTPPAITSIVGCEYDFYPSTANCFLNGTSMVNIRGSNFGSSGAKVYFYYQTPIGATTRIEATTVTHSSSTSINATGFPGSGQRFDVAVETADGEFTREKFVTMSYVASVVIPCPTSSGVQCGGNGNCQTAIGVCSCFNDTTNGFWTGAACDTCQEGRYGASCAGTCPGYPNVCGGAGLGTCSEGLTGNGTCTCASGYGGTSCSYTCPGGTANPCSGRGVCVQGIDPPVCSCHSNPTDGYWGGSACLECAPLYIGSKCQFRCPTTHLTPTLKCNGEGVCAPSSSAAVCINCNTTYCGAACNLTGSQCGICPTAQWGVGCAFDCPGYNRTTGSGSACGGSGLCSEGVQGTGQCVCNAGYAGVDCSTSCPGTADGNPCSGHGACDQATGTCNCDPGYGTSNCSVACPGHNTTDGACSGNGICNSGSNKNATCTCNLGYSGLSCNETCPGGVTSPCSYHGVCNQNVSCSCFNDDILGYWSVSSNCSKCVTDWWGSYCNGTCPINDGAQCANHGECTDAVECRCHASASQGYWAEPNCTECKPNYWGTNCTRQCPGGACNACNGKGICSDGRNGTGVCGCFSNTTQGYWTGTKCNECQSTYYGELCTLRCPIVSGQLCSDKGYCFDGVAGNGTCACFSDDTNGYWGSPDCADCSAGYYGANCTSACIGITEDGLPCSGHGTCDSGSSGTGACTCAFGWGSSDCSTPCEVGDNDELCSGNGFCLQGADQVGGCRCYNSSDLGFWNGTACGDCNTSSYGSSCIQSCPHNSSGYLCSNHGTCNYGVNGSGTCSCDSGWAGSDCSILCPGGEDKPCNNHGTCDSTYGNCTCYLNDIDGYWDGDTCNTCYFTHNGSESGGCKTACPVDDTNNDVCSGHGICLDGSCVACDTGYCHDKTKSVKACQQSGGCASCPDGYYGNSCEYLCPGSGTCSGHGFCDRDMESPNVGTCTCFAGSGYWGSMCYELCPGNGTCSDHGTCNQATGVCTCDDGYQTQSCAVECPGGASNKCSGHGECLSDGTCSCETGYALDDCSAECPPGNVNSSTQICHGHGVCGASTALCTCDNDEQHGFWTGDACQGCQTGFFGSNCLSACYNGTTNGTDCICNDGWSGSACDQPCPGLLGNGTRCSGHGTCNWGHTMEKGNCTCDSNYFTQDCSVWCSETKCSSAPYFLQNGECDASTGDCACIDDNVNGHWTNTKTQCTTCTMLYYGPECLLECQCGGHGTCDKESGACLCFDDDANGHFDGSACDKCKEGYVGESCKGKDVAVTRQRPCSAITQINATSSFILMDTDNDVIMTGARPVIICNLTTKNQIKIVDVNGSVVSGRFEGENYIVLTLNELDNATSKWTQQQIRVHRGRSPTFWPVPVGGDTGKGTPYTPAIAHAGNTSSTYAMRRQLQEVHFYDTPQLIETIRYVPQGSTTGDEEVITVFSNGVVQHTKGLNVDGEYAFNGAFRQVLGAAVTNSRQIAQKLILGGSLAGQWRIITVSLPMHAGSTTSYTDITPTVTDASPYCSTSAKCLSAGKIVSQSVWLYVSAIRQKGVGVNKFRLTLLDDPTRFRVEYNAIVATTLTSPPYPEYNVTSFIIDDYSTAGFIAINGMVDGVRDPSTIFKFDILSLQVYGSARFQKVVDDYEIVRAFTKNDVTRTLYATVPLREQLNIVPLNLFAVTAIYPTMADTVGGTVVTVTGEGFTNDDYLFCDFNSTLVKASWHSSRNITCIAPVGGDERCEGTPLEVTIGPDQLTKNDVRLRRVSSPQIVKTFAMEYTSDLVDNSYGDLDGGHTAVLEGSGFQESPYLSCRFKSDALHDAKYAVYSDRDYAESGGKQGVLYMQAKFINATRVECKQPKFEEPTYGRSRVEVTLDGTVWSTTGKEYQIIGPAAGIKTFHGDAVNGWQPNYIQQYTSQKNVTLDPIHLFVVDKNTQRLRRLDSSPRNISIVYMPSAFASMDQYQGDSAAFNWTNECQVDRPALRDGFISSSTRYAMTENGKVTFDGWYIQEPLAGTYTMRITDLSTDWQYDHKFFIDVGEAFALKVCQQPPAEIDNLSPTFTQHPRLYIVDIVGNMLPAMKLSGRQVNAQYPYKETTTLSLSSNPRDLYGVPVFFNRTQDKIETRVAQLDGDFLKFDQLEMKGLHGEEYRITFSSPGLIGVMSRPIRVKKCSDTRNITGALQYFSKLGTSECFVCPAGAVCDGSHNIQIVHMNLWRPSNDSYKFYSCASPLSGDSCTVPNGSCIEGYKGPRCSVCEKGYGKDGFYCSECRSPGTVVGFMVLLIAITLIFVAVLVYASFTTPTQETLPILMKIAINHFQVASRVTEIVTVPDALLELFTIFLALSELIRFDIVSGECPPLELTVYGRFYLAVSVPFFIMALFGFIYFGLFVYRKIRGIGPKCIKIEVGNSAKPPRRDRVMLTVSKFMSKLKAAAFEYRGNLSRDDEIPQFYNSIQYFTATAIIILVLVYPTVLQWCASMWKCDDIVYGDSGSMPPTLRSVSYLSLDRSIVCTDNEHRLVQAIALAAALFYGIGVPIISILFVHRHWKKHGRVHTRRLYTYVTAGFDISTWWWESVVMGRKAVIVFIIIFVTDEILRTYLAMWTMTLALGAHGWFQPYDPRRPSLYYLEGTGIVALVVTLNLSLLFQFDTFSANTTGYWILVIFLFAMNVLVIALYAIFILIQVGKRIRTWITGKKEDLDESKQMSEARRKSMITSSYAPTTFVEKDFTSFRAMDRHELQKEGILGALRRASEIHSPEGDEEHQAINTTTLPPKAGETPFERVQRLESERLKEAERTEQIGLQGQLENELEDLRDRMIRAQALAAAEEAIVARNKDMEIARRRHEEELLRLMDEIRKERGEFVAKADHQKEFQRELMQSIQFEMDDDDEEGEEGDDADSEVQEGDLM